MRLTELRSYTCVSRFSYSYVVPSIRDIWVHKRRLEQTKLEEFKSIHNTQEFSCWMWYPSQQMNMSIRSTITKNRRISFQVMSADCASGLIVWNTESSRLMPTSVSVHGRRLWNSASLHLRPRSPPPLILILECLLFALYLYFLRRLVKIPGIGSCPFDLFTWYWSNVSWTSPSGRKNRDVSFGSILKLRGMERISITAWSKVKRCSSASTSNCSLQSVSSIYHGEMKPSN